MSTWVTIKDWRKLGGNKKEYFFPDLTFYTFQGHGLYSKQYFKLYILNISIQWLLVI